VVVTGAPLTTTLVGDSVRLVATAVNATGGVVSNQSVTWRSSAPTVAAVGANGTVVALGAGQAIITASVGAREGTATLDVADGATLGVQGGTLTAAGGALSLVLPAGALSQSTLLLVRPVASAVGARLVPGTAYDIAPEGVALARAGTLALRYDPARLPSGVTAASLQLYVASGTQWQQVPGSTVDTVARRVTGTMARSGTYAVLGTPVGRVALTGPALGGALFVGQSAQLGATVHDPAGAVVTGRVVRWESSEPSRATVDGSGRVTAVGAGAVTITATAEERSASTTLTILARTTPDWSQATEWTTYQGNAAHTGYVPVTADAGAFRELWVATPFGSVALNPVTVGGGRVFASTNSYFGANAQWAGALDAQTGAVQWSRSFGDIHGVHPPAYGDGSVYVTTSGHENSFLWRLDAATGAVRFRSAYGNQWSRYYAPVVAGGTVYMAGGYYGGAYGFGTADGAQRWFTSLNQYDQWSPAVQGGLVYAYTGSYAPKLSVLEAATGRAAFEIADPRFSWEGWSMNLAPVLGFSNDVLVTNGGRLLSFDLRARAIRWEQRGQFTGTVTVADSLLYVVNNGQVDIRRASDGSLVAPWVPPEGRVQPPMIVTRNLLFASTGANTYAVDLATRRQVWSYPAAGALALGGQGILFIAQGNGRLAAIALR
jgi:outer membrane protein assembly factor BamB